MMKQYEEPLMSVMWIEQEDVIRTSDEDETPVVRPQGRQGDWF